MVRIACDIPDNYFIKLCKKVYTEKVINFTNINKTNDHLSASRT